jgi:hypothetical protein
MSSGREAAEQLPTTEARFDEDSPQVEPSTEQSPSPTNPLRWQDRLLWAWPALIIGAMAVCSQWGSAWVLAAGIGGTMTVAALTGSKVVGRKPMVIFLTVASALLVGVVALGISYAGPGQLRAGENQNGTNLSGAQLNGTVAPGVSLVDADLTGAHLAGAKLPGADLSAAHLGGADLRGADLSGANLRAADLTKACLLGANLSGATLDGATMSGANVSKVTVAGDEALHARDWPAPGQASIACR